MSEYTKGPWTMTPIRRGDKEIYIDGAGDGWNRLGCEVTRDDCDTETALANAHLICAAPELLEALKAIIEDDGSGIDLFTNGRAAIAKAIGTATHTAIGNSEKIGEVG